jgi:hypothetical protein
MWPTFELYNSIMNGSWMLWMERYTHTIRLQRLLNAVHPMEGCLPDVFFRELHLLLDYSGYPAMARLRSEVMNLALHSPPAGSSCPVSFFQLPSAGYRQYFIHLLTGFSLGGYEQWMKRIEASAHNEHCRMYFRRRMMEKLESFIDLRIWQGESPSCELQMVCLVKTALCILYSRLAGNGSHLARGFCAGERLQQQLSNSGLEEVDCTRLMSLFNSLTARPEAVPVPAILAVSADAAMPSLAEDSNVRQMTAVTEAELATLLTDLKLNFDELKQEIETTLKGAALSAGKEVLETNQLLDYHKAQEMLGVSKATMNRYRKKGLLPYTQIGGKIMYTKEDVMKLKKKISRI